MSAKNIEVQLKKLGMKNDIVGLEAFVTSVEDDKVIPTYTVMSSAVHGLHYLHGVSCRKNTGRLKL
jgi:hypothetical protein